MRAKACGYLNSTTLFYLSQSLYHYVTLHYTLIMFSINIPHKNVSLLSCSVLCIQNLEQCLAHSSCLINEWVRAKSESEDSLLIIELAQGALDELDDGWNQIKVALTNSIVLNTLLVKTFSYS